MARELFVDTSAWYPIIVKGHPDHVECAEALQAAVANGNRVVTTNLILAETHVLISRRVGRDPALVFLETVREPPNLIVTSDADLEAVALIDWLAPFEDQDFSLTDAVSFAVMTDRKIEQALTLDHHFAGVGFEMLPT